MTQNYSNDLTKYIKQWIIYDDFIKECNRKSKLVRQKKELIESKVTQLLEQNSLTNTKINIGNNNISYQETSSTSALSYKFIQDCLSKYLKENEVNKICEILKNERDKGKKTITTLKRTIIE